MKPHVLVVDDSLSVRMDLRAVLNSAGFLVTACDTKVAAQKALRSRSYALVILDVVLPDGSGIDLLKEVRAMQETTPVPVIMLSSESEVKDRIRGLTTGADVYVGKPYDSMYLIRCARELTRAQETASSPADSTTFTGKKILAVDDSPTYLNKLAEVLRQDRHDVVLASSGEEALKFLAVETVDAIILDLLMPGIGGLETCRRIRRSVSLHSIPVLMLTGRDDDNARDAGISAGVDEFVVKSPELELLKVRLRALLRKKRLEQASREAEEKAPPSSGLWRKQEEVPPGSLLYRVVMNSGLSNVIGPSTIARACKRVGVDAKTMTTKDLERALPSLRDTLSMFFSQEETEWRVDALAALARAADAA